MKSEQIKEVATLWGASTVRIADLSLLNGIETHPANLLEGHRTAISLAVRLADAVVDSVVNGPTPLYHQHQLKVNALLDEIAVRITNHIQGAGGKAVPIPASHILDRTHWHSYISHKAVAIAAGVGWQGKSLVVVNREWGPRIRLATVLTDFRFEPDEPVLNLCGACSSCAEACPGNAIKNVNTKLHYSDRDEALFLDRCAAKVAGEFTGIPGIEGPTCGVCIRVCPWGRKQGAAEA
ncbi:MAG: 4Fe-4S double cluster binding domain-containing protein [Desulfomonilaceae bacterium]